MNLWLSAVTAALLVFAAVVAARRSRAVTAILCLSLVAQTVVFPGFLTPEEIPFGWRGMDRAQLLILVASALIVAVALPGARAFQARSPLRPAEHLLAASAAASALGLAGLAASAALRGSLGDRWSRTADWATPHAGLLTAASAGVLLFPLVVLHLRQTGAVVRQAVAVLAVVNFAVAAGFFALSGVSTMPLALLAPLGVLAIFSDGRIRLLRVAGVIVVAFTAIGILRFARFYGAAAYTGLGASGPQSLAVGAIVGDYNRSRLVLWKSFGEMHAFSAVVEWVDDDGELLMGESYLVLPAALVPGALWPGKAAFLEAARADYFTRDRIIRRSAGLIPSGFYGEAHLNFGTAGLLVASLLLGLAVRAIDSRIHTSLFGLPGALGAALACGALLVVSRNGVSQGAVILLSQVFGLRVLSLIFPGTVPARGPASRTHGGRGVPLRPHRP